MALAVFIPNQNLTGLDSGRKPARTAKGATFFNRPPEPPERYVFQPPFTIMSFCCRLIQPDKVTKCSCHGCNEFINTILQPETLDLNRFNLALHAASYFLNTTGSVEAIPGVLKAFSGVYIVLADDSGGRQG